MWHVTGIPADAGRFTPFDATEVLYTFDGPKTFTFHDRQGQMYLAHWCDEDREIMRFIVVPFTPALLLR